jgi:hypothetical protein
MVQEFETVIGTAGYRPPARRVVIVGYVCLAPP